jgi:alkylated DNA repair dioxygenase AlkB
MSAKFYINQEASYLYVIDDFISKSYADDLLKSCGSLDLVTEPKVKTGTCHRRVGFFSDKVKGYYFSGQLTASKPPPSFLTQLLDTVNKSFKEVLEAIKTGLTLNAILVNEYRDGTDYIGSHSDNEKGLNNLLVACISLGASRKFRIRRKDGAMPSGESFLDIPTKHGQLLVMGGDFQKLYKHEVPSEKKLEDGHRISLTFRCHFEDK